MSPVGTRPQGPVRVRGAVAAHRRLGGYHALALTAPEVAERAEPGQFLSLGVAAGGTVLRRPFSLRGVDRPDPGAVEVVFDVSGAGTAWLAERRPGDAVDVVGPLGRPFPLPADGGGALLVGGGYGAAPVLYLAEVLAERGVAATVVLGAASAGRLLDAEGAASLAAAVHLATDDGSLGTRGYVTEVVPGLLDAGAVGVVYACGPMPMLRAVAALARARSVPCWVAVEEHMACGTGVCWTCVLPVRAGGGLRNVRACTEGPVLDGAAIAWEAIGTAAMGNPPLQVAPSAPGRARA